MGIDLAKALRLHDVRDQTFSKSLFERIRLRLSNSLSADDSMQHIESVMDMLDIGDLGETFFDVIWDLTFFRDEMDESQSLGSMITFTGSVDAAWAATSREYVERMWPETGLTTLNAIEKAIQRDQKGYFFDGDFGVEARRAYIKVQGSKRQTIEVAQQLAWMMSVFRARRSRDSDKKHYSHYQIDVQHKNRVSLSLLPLEEVHEDDASCWLPLLHGSVIAHGFPIPQRGHEAGVEMSLDVIVPLAGVQYPVHIKEITILKGWTTLLYPVGASQDFGSIQWHLVACDDPDDPRMLQALSSVSYVANWRDVGLDSIRTSRSFVGYCKSARIHLGTEYFKPQYSEDKSGALVESSRMFWQKKVTVNIGSSGMGAFGLEVAGEIGFSRTAIASMAARENFDRVLDLSRRTPVIMYDVTDCTAWLVPEISVVLHMARSWFLERQDLAENEVKKLPSAVLSEDGASAAMEAIANHKSLELKRNTGTSTWKFMDIVKDSVRLLKACRDTKDRTQSSSSVSWLLSWFQSPRLYGWDMADLIDGRDYTSRKEILVHKNLNNKWISSIANHPDVLVIFCANIAAPIRPAKPEKICCKWNPVPSEKNYLVASVQCLKDLARHCNGGDDGRKLTEKCYWSRPRGTYPWAVCNFESKKGCNRLQEIVEKNPKRPVKLYQHGAVIFGGSALPREKCRPSENLSPEKGSGAINGVSDEDTGKTLLGSPPLIDNQRDQQSPEPDEDDNDQALIAVSPQRVDSQQSESFEGECRAIAAALAQRHDRHETSDDLDELINEGRAIFEQFRQQGLKLQKQKLLVDEMSMLLGSTPESAQESS